MRSLKLTSVLAAVAALALATAGVAAAHHPHAKHLRKNSTPGVCHVSMNVAPRLITSGESVLAYGQLRCHPGTEGGQTVTLYDRTTSPGGGAYTVAGTATTDSHGLYQIPVGPLSTNTTFYATAGGDESALRYVRVAAQVTLVGPEEGKQLSIKTGKHNAVTFTGTVSPDLAGARVVLQRQNSVRGNEWHRIGQTVVTSDGTTGAYAITHIFRVPGDSNIRVLVRAGRHTVASPSNVLSYEISQAQNPSLTIEASPDPIVYGGSVVISGNVPGEPNTTVTLVSHSPHTPFTAVTTAKTDGTGAYTFPAQSPTTSTYYQVRSADRNSAVLYEGVKYILTAGVSATTIEAGQPLTFSGTVTPVQTGHVIYLEKQNLSGLGFHVTETGTEGPAGEYSIAHTLFVPGTYVLRVKIPGGPTNNTTTSAPFTITVTPNTKGPIKPESPGNSGLPSEGQV